METIIIKPNEITKTVTVLKHGGLLIYPTETCYGIGCDITNKIAIEKIFDVKQRPKDRKLICLVSSLEMAAGYGILTENDVKIVKNLMPGPITLVVRKRPFLPENLGDEFAFRISSNEIANNIVEQFGKPIASTSANISGRPPCYKIKDVIDAFYGKVEMIVDGGDLTPTKPSTVIDLFDGKLNIRREGPISKQQILEALK